MSINALEYSNQSSGLYNIFGTNGVNGVDAVSSYGSGTGSTSSTRSSGDTVSISDEARELFARKLQMLKVDDDQTEQVLNLGAGSAGTAKDNSTSVDNGITDADRNDAGASTEAGAGSAQTSGEAGASGGGGGGGSSESSSEDERQKELEAELKTLQGQLQGIMSQPGDPDSKMNKASPVENRMRSVEAELQALKTQSAKTGKG